VVGPSQASPFAVSHRSKTNGEWQDVNDGFFRCAAWPSVPENASRSLTTGMRVFVAGKLVQRSWQDNDGNKRQIIETQVTHVGSDLQFPTAGVPSPPHRAPQPLRRLPGNSPNPTRSKAGFDRAPGADSSSITRDIGVVGY
jgi:single-stranded DNA-binding protein